MEETLEEVIDYKNYKVEKDKYKYVVCTNSSSKRFGQLGFYYDHDDSDYVNYQIIESGDILSDTNSKLNFFKNYTPLTDDQKSKYQNDIKMLDDMVKKFDLYDYLTRKADDYYNEYYQVTEKLKSSITEDYLKSLFENFYKHVDKVKALTEEVYGASNVCIVQDAKAGTFSANILFNDITINNSHKDRSHNIKDLVVRIPFTYDKAKDSIRVSDTIQGTRLTVTYSEIKSSYRHSHLPSDSANQRFQTFCLGATDVNIINTDLKVAFNETKYILFLNMLTTYVKWESLEGGPYIKFEGISSRGSSYHMSSNLHNDLIGLVNNIMIDFNLSFDAVNKTFKVLRDAKLESEILKHTTGVDRFKEMFIFRDVNGSEFRGGLSKTEVENDIKRYESTISVDANVSALKFTGKPTVKLAIINDVDDSKEVKVISKQAIDYVAQRLETNLNNYIANKSL